jgi:hypothetical protein
MRFSWRSGNLDTVVSWSLVPEGTGTRLLITHDGFDDTDPGQRMVMGILGGLARAPGPAAGDAAGRGPRLAAAGRPGSPDPVLGHLQLGRDLGWGTGREAARRDALGHHGGPFRPPGSGPGRG